jgi:hypothetical protein
MATVREIKDQFIKKELSTRGNKATLIKRLALADKGDNCSICEREAIIAASVKENDPSLLIKPSTDAILKNHARESFL